MIATHKKTKKQYNVTGQVNVIHIEDEQEVLYTHYSIEPDDSDIVSTIEMLDGYTENSEFTLN